MRILIADDDPQILRALRITLAARGYEVLLARDGAEALSVAVDRHPDLYLLDLGMPRLDGIKVIEFNARFGDPETQVLAMRLGAQLLDACHAAATGALAAARVNLNNFSSQSLGIALDEITTPEEVEALKARGRFYRPFRAMPNDRPAAECVYVVAMPHDGRIAFPDEQPAPVVEEPERPSWSRRSVEPQQLAATISAPSPTSATPPCSSPPTRPPTSRDKH